MNALQQPGGMTPAALKALLEQIAEGGFSDHEVDQARELRRRLHDTPHADLVRSIATDVLQGYQSQGRIARIIANLRDPVRELIPSTTWVNSIPAVPSAETISGWRQRISENMRVLAEKLTGGTLHRLFHAKTIFATPGKLKLYASSGLPEGARVGLFAPNADPNKPLELTVAVRGSNGKGCPFMNKGGKIESYPDKDGDVRGLAVLIERAGVQSNITSTNQTRGQHVADVASFMQFAEAQSRASAKGNTGIQANLDSTAEIVKEFGLGAGGVLARIGRDTINPPESLAAEAFVGSIVRSGDYLMKIVFVPAPGTSLETKTDDPNPKRDPDYLVKDAENRGRMKWIMCAQMYTNDRDTPLDNSTKAWKSPLIPVGELETRPSGNADVRKAEREAIEAMSFNPGVYDSGPPPKTRPELKGTLLDIMGNARHDLYDEGAKTRGAWSSAKTLAWLRDISLAGRP